MITITGAKPSHVAALVNLFAELDRHYGITETDPADLRIRQINDTLFDDHPSAYAILAWDGSNLAGVAAYSFLWPAVGLTRSLFLKELYVAAEARRRGVGRLLMQRLCAIAVQRDCSRVEWHTDLENPGAQQFYADLGVPVDGSKLFYRLQGDDVRRLARL